MVASPIVGPAYRARSPNVDNDACINLFLETVETKTGKVPAFLQACPGLDFEATVGIGPIRGVHVVGQTLYVASGAFAYMVSPGFLATQIGEFATTSGKVSIIDNGSQVAFSDRNQIYVWSAGTWVIPVLSSIGPPGDLVYQDTLGVYNEIGTFNLWQSNPNDLTTWDPLDFDTADGSPQPIIGLAELHRQIVPLKADSAEFWINAGNQGFVFQRLDGVFPQIGLAVAATLTNCGEEICWLGSDDGGNGVVYAMGGYEPRRVSTFAQEYAISQYQTISDAVAFSYLQAGHRFYVISFPTAGETWTLDFTVSAQLGFPCWHQRASFINGFFGVYEPVCSALFNGKIVVGSGWNGNLYELDLQDAKDGLYTIPAVAVGSPSRIAETSFDYPNASITVTTSGAAAAGSLLYLMLVFTGSATYPTVTDSAGNGYTLTDSYTVSTTLMAIYTCVNSNGLASGGTITLAGGGWTSFASVIAATLPDVGAQYSSSTCGHVAETTSSPPVSGTFDVPAGPSYAFMAMSFSTNPTSITSGWTLLGSVFPAYAPFAALYVQAFAAPNPSLGFTFNWAGGSGNLFLVMDVFGGIPASTATYTRKWLRSWRAHPSPQIKAMRYHCLEIDMESGVQVTPGGNPQVMLRYSDNAHSWSSEKFAAAGPGGQYSWRVRFRRLGAERRGLASDRTFELSATDLFKTMILGADVDVSE